MTAWLDFFANTFCSRFWLRCFTDELPFGMILEESEGDYLKDLLGVSITPTDKIYEASQRIAYVEEELFFVNEQIGTYKQYEGRGNSIPNLMNYKNSNLVAEGINLSLDVNNRYRYLMNGDSIQIKELTAVIEKIYGIVERNFSKWS